MAREPSLLPLLLSRRKAFDIFAPCLNEFIYPALYRRFKTDVPSRDDTRCSLIGCIFNIQFSPSDSLVLAACSNKKVVGYDPRISTATPIRNIKNAHCDCVNCITFIDETTFVTCSDDKTIRVWDLRNLSSCMCILEGHTNWIKNIEYDKISNKVFSVAFQDGVREWSLDKLKGDTCEELDNFVLKLSDPVRMRIAPDSSKMFISLRRNMCLVIDGFDGATVAEQQKTVQELVADPALFKQNISASDRNEWKTNRPSLAVMSGLRSDENSYRSIMSVSFHPNSEVVALRHVDIRRNHIQQELSTLYDIREAEEDGPFQSYLPVAESSRRYLKYADEHSPDDSLDYIKECCFSADGRVLASPHINGVRLLAVDSSCTPMELYYDKRFFSTEKTAKCYDFEVVGCLSGHSNPVLACAFAHHDLILSTGCMEGQIVFHKPQL